MEVALVDKNTIKIKGKNAAFIVDPTSSIPKTSSDAILFLEDIDTEDRISKVDDYRVQIKGAGSFEIGGVRINSERGKNKFLYTINIDNLNIFLSSVSAVGEAGDKNSCDILLLNADEEIKESIISSFEASVVVLYGDKAESSVKLLGKEFESLSKFTASADKLPSDMKLVLLK